LPRPCPRTRQTHRLRTRDGSGRRAASHQGVGEERATPGDGKGLRASNQNPLRARARTGKRGNTRPHVSARAAQRSAALHRDGRRPPARRDPPPTRRGEARATVGKRHRQQLRVAVVARPLKSRSRGARVPKHRGAATERASRGGAAAGGSGTPRHPLGTLEKGFLTEGASSPPQRKQTPIEPAKPHLRATPGAGGERGHNRGSYDPDRLGTERGCTRNERSR